ncbi:MAG: FprA family A-type flavoprotein [Lachnospiraceae bacterium]|nr:FprA family A-type flavoprotein [Lachnospiraceae bacterium]
MTITDDIKYIGVNDYDIDLFEGLYKVPNGMSYNSYVIMDEKIAVLDSVEAAFAEQWMHNLEEVLGDREPDYLIVQHMEPDHSANIMNFMSKYPKVTIVASARAFEMMKNFFGVEFGENRRIVADGDILLLGNHKLIFMTAPMIHWPEVLVTYDSTEKVMFSADAFGKFGTVDTQEEWIEEARRYYVGIVGKYGIWVQKLFQKIEDWDIQMICPLHGPVLFENIEYYIEKYNRWSTYEPEEDGVVIAYTSIYGNTKKAVVILEQMLRDRGCEQVVIKDLARCDISDAVANSFRYSKLVLATTTYNADVFPPMREFIKCLTERNFCNRTVAFIENGSWAPIAAMLMREMLEKSKQISYTETTVRILSALNDESETQLEQLADELCKIDCNEE